MKFISNTATVTQSTACPPYYPCAKGCSYILAGVLLRTKGSAVTLLALAVLEKIYMEQ